MLNPDELKQQRLTLELCKQLHPIKWNALTMEQRRALIKYVQPDSLPKEIEKAFRKVNSQTLADTIIFGLCMSVPVILLALSLITENSEWNWR